MHVLVTSPRVAPGLMTRVAWDVLGHAEQVLCPDPDDPTAQAVRASGVEVATGPAPTTATPGTVWLAPVGDVGWAEQLASRLVESGSDAAEVEVVFGSYDLPGARLLDLVDVMGRLRRECPWTREQTHESLSGYLLEESYEVLEALDHGDHDHLREELGDVLMQVVFHAAVAQGAEQGWSIDDVAEEIVAKLIARNPHVFGDEQVSSAAEVDANWRAIKAAEKRRSSVLEGIPATLPALAYAAAVVDRLEREGADVAVGSGDDIGDRLLALVLEARIAGTDPEAALRRVVRGLVP